MRSRTGAHAAIVAFGLAACSPQTGRLGTGTPSLDTARTALTSGAPELALQICNTRLEKGERRPDVLVCQGNALAALGRNGEAGASFAAALAANPGLPEALFGVGRLRLATDPVEAERLFLQALSKQPHNPIALNNLGIAQDLQGRHQDAQTAYGEAIQAAPDMRAPRVNLALSMALNGRTEEASRLLSPMADQPTATSRERHDFAAVLAMEGRSAEATRYLQPELSGPQLEDALAGFRAMRALAVPETRMAVSAVAAPAQPDLTGQPAPPARPPANTPIPVNVARSITEPRRRPLIVLHPVRPADGITIASRLAARAKLDPDQIDIGAPTEARSEVAIRYYSADDHALARHLAGEVTQMGFPWRIENLANQSMASGNHAIEVWLTDRWIGPGT